MTGGSSPLWRPSAGLDAIRARAELNRSVRAFFDARGVLEVETPILSRHATVDRYIESFHSDDGHWLQTSPEFAMKRLIAAGSGPIWQIARVFRLEEAGRHHNPEFTMLEWYRPDWDHHQLMDEVEALLRHCLPQLDSPGFDRLSYAEAMSRHAGVDAFGGSLESLRRAAQALGYDASADARDACLDVLMTLAVSPRLGVQRPCFVYDFPASQAALARVREGDPPVAERFELFWRGVELANGFHELSDAVEQQRRFEADVRWRTVQGLRAPPWDRNLVSALAHGFPDCAGVALGLDRVLMLAGGFERLDQVIAFASERA